MNLYADVTTLKSDAYLRYEGEGEDVYFRGLLEAASRMIDDYTGRFFYCDETTRYYDGAGAVLWTDDILSITTLKTDDDDDKTYENTLTENTDFYLLPYNKTVKTRAKIRVQGSYSGFASGVAKGVEIIGVFGYGDSATPYHSSGTTLDGTLTIDAVEVAVYDGTAFSIGQTMRVQDEQMYITAIAFNVLTVKRGVNTDAATHASALATYIYDYPEPIKEACLIQAMRWWTRKDSAFADVVGVPELGTVVVKKGLDPDIRNLLRPYRRYA